MEKKKPNSLSDFDIRTDADASDSRSSIPRLNGVNSVVFALALGGVAFTGCSDEKTCSDADVSSYADPYQVTDPYDSYDYGSDSDVSSSGDAIGNGYTCRDYD